MRSAGEPLLSRPSVRRAAWAAAILLPALFLLGAWLILRALEPSLVSGSRGAQVADFTARPVAENREAPSFQVPTLTGRGSIALRRFAGRVVVLNLWASWCDPCRAESPALEEVWESYRSRGVQFVGIDHQDSRSNGLGFRRAFGLTYPSGFDPAGTLAWRFGALGIPTTYVIDRDGRIVYRFLGKIRPGTLAEILDRVLAGRE
jgi:cytochrome c biogenesis protein CcmG/thiol:disulfide interchange protein DsbE